MYIWMACLMWALKGRCPSSICVVRLPAQNVGRFGPNQNKTKIVALTGLPLRMTVHVVLHLLDHSLLRLLPSPALNVSAGRAPREASKGSTGEKAADGDERATEHGPAGARHGGHRQRGACGQGGAAKEGNVGCANLYWSNILDVICSNNSFQICINVRDKTKPRNKCD